MKTVRKKHIPLWLTIRCLVAFWMLLVLQGSVGVGSVLASAGNLQLQVAFDNTMVDISNPQNKYLELLVTAPLKNSWLASQRLPLNICLVIDNSGSMAGEKIAYVKEAAAKVVDMLQFGDRFSVVTYNNDAQVLISPQLKKNLYRVQQRIADISPGGGTNSGAGLVVGYQQIERYYSPRYTNRVLLLSDGHANQGIVSSRELGGLVQSFADRNISLSTFGVGDNFNENLMAALSENGRGMYNFIDHPEQISLILQREFQLCEQLSATGIELVVTFKNGMVVNKVMANKYKLQGRRLSIPVGDISVGERRRYQIRVQPPLMHTGFHEMATVKLKYTVAGQDMKSKTSARLKLQYGHNVGNLQAFRNAAVKERSAIFEAHFARGEAAKAVDRGDMQLAQNILANVSRRIQGQTASSAKVREEAQLIDGYSDSLRKKPSVKVLRRIQKRVKYDTHSIEGC